MINPEQVALGKSLLGKTLRFRHMNEPWGKVSAVMRDGMIEFDNKGGYFAPDLFVEVCAECCGSGLTMQPGMPDGEPEGLPCPKCKP